MLDWFFFSLSRIRHVYVRSLHFHFVPHKVHDVLPQDKIDLGYHVRVIIIY